MTNSTATRSPTAIDNTSQQEIISALAARIKNQRRALRQMQQHINLTAAHVKRLILENEALKRNANACKSDT